MDGVAVKGAVLNTQGKFFDIDCRRAQAIARVVGKLAALDANGRSAYVFHQELCAISGVSGKEAVIDLDRSDVIVAGVQIQSRSGVVNELTVLDACVEEATGPGGLNAQAVAPGVLDGVLGEVETEVAPAQKEGAVAGCSGDQVAGDQQVGGVVAENAHATDVDRR